MGLLEKFSKEEKDLFAALPYRVGVWVSQCDETGGAESDTAEIAALRSIIRGFAEDFCKTEFVEEIMKETIARNDQWSIWEKNAENVLTECSRAVEMAAAHFEERHVTSFKNNLMEIGIAVALAYREFDERHSFATKLTLRLRYFRQRMMATFRKKKIVSFEEYLNISRAEHRALSQLSGALRMEYREGLVPRSSEAGA